MNFNIKAKAKEKTIKALTRRAIDPSGAEPELSIKVGATAAPPPVPASTMDADLAAQLRKEWKKDWLENFPKRAEELRKKVAQRDPTLTTTTRLRLPTREELLLVLPEPTIAQLEKWHEDRTS